MWPHGEERHGATLAERTAARHALGDRRAELIGVLMVAVDGHGGDGDRNEAAGNAKETQQSSPDPR
jgi:hypothetical protein